MPNGGLGRDDAAPWARGNGSGLLRAKILVVDDSLTIRRVLHDTLIRIGIPQEAIEGAENGREALERFRSFEPDIVFLDLDMPELPGDEVATQMLEDRPLVKIVVLSGVERTDPRIRRLLSMGVFEILEKPIRTDQIRKLLKSVEEEEGGASPAR